ncbi:ShlB/FhaC/HecB family hemolysin secretion/activation protein [Pigmentiphaga soli]
MADEPAAVAAADPSVRVDRVDFSGNRAFTSAQLSSLIASDIGKPMSLQAMRELASKIQDYYHKAGYSLATVVVPAQDFAHMEALKLTVLEGWLGRIDVRGNARYGTERVVAALNAAGVVQGKTFTLAQVEKGLTQLNRQSGIAVTSTLQPGKETGSTDLVVNVVESPRISGSVEFNNYGSKNTGKNRLMPSVKFADLTGRGDELNALAMTAVGAGDLNYQYVSYATPLNAIGTKLQAYFANGNVGVGREYEALNIKGDNKSLGVGIAQDFIRSSRTVFNAEAWLEAQNLKQEMLDTTTAKDKIRKLRFGVGLDNTGLASRNLAAFGVQVGLGQGLGGMDDESLMSSRSYARADNSFTKLTLDLGRVQRITSRISLIPRFSGQYSTKSLVSSEQWTIGGINSVAGFQPALFSGDSGFTASVEARYSLLSDDNRYQLFTRIDHGRVYTRTPFLGQERNNHLTGVTFGVLAEPIKAVDVRMDLAVPVGDKEGTSPVFFVQAQYHF